MQLLDPPQLFHSFLFFFFNDTATTEIYTLSLHDALPIFVPPRCGAGQGRNRPPPARQRSEEHTSELQSHVNLVCRLLLEKKKRRMKGRGILKDMKIRVAQGESVDIV